MKFVICVLSPVNAEDTGDVYLIPGLGRSTGEENGNPPLYSCLKNPMDRGAWWATVQRVARSCTKLSTSTYLEKCIVSLLTMLPMSRISAEPSTERTMHKYLLLLTYNIKILNNNQTHG